MFRTWIAFLFLVLSSIASAQVAGDVVEIKTIGSFTIEQIKTFKAQLGIKTPTTSSVTAYKISYYTTDLYGKLTVATAGVAAANDQPVDQRPVVSYQHGTTTERDLVPSSGRTELMLNAAIYSSNGYVVVAADYLGLGDEKSFHPYLHADTEASACADALIAMYQAQLSTSKKLFLTGYSQGGHATMALHRYWQSKYGSTRPVTAAAPLAGPYDLSGSVIYTAQDLAKISLSSVTYTGYLIFSMENIYGFDAGLKKTLLSPYAEKIPALYDGTHAFKEIQSQLPQTLKEFLTTSMIESVKNNSSDNRFLEALRKNDVYDWKSEAPIQFCHGDADLDVPPVNTVTAMKRMKELGSTVTQAVILKGLTHSTAATPCFAETAKFFESFRIKR